MITATIKMLDKVAPIAALERSNGPFQRHVAYDVHRRGPCLELVTVTDLVEVIEEANARYNRLHDCRPTDADVEWAIGYSKWEGS